MTGFRRLFIRRDGVVLGPFTPEQLKNLRAAGELPEGTEFSPDKREWRLSETPPAPVEPPSPADAPQAFSSPVQTPTPGDNSYIPLTVVAPVPAAGTAGKTVVPVLEAAESSWSGLQLLGCTMALLWESDDFLRRLRRGRSGAIFLSVFFAILLAFVLCGTALGLFAARYSCSSFRLTAVVLSALPGSLIFFYLGFGAVRLCRLDESVDKPELDLFAAAFGTLQLALLLTLMLALAFLRNPALYHLPSWGGKVLAAGAAAAMVFCIGQTLSGFRSHLTNHLAIAPGCAARIGIVLLWLCLTVIGYLFVPCIVF